MYAHDDGPLAGNVLTANNMNLCEERDQGPSRNPAEETVQQVGVWHDYETVDMVVVRAQALHWPVCQYLLGLR